jgi:5'-methylthioadenosine phosphorylase
MNMAPGDFGSFLIVAILLTAHLQWRSRFRQPVASPMPRSEGLRPFSDAAELAGRAAGDHPPRWHIWQMEGPQFLRRKANSTVRFGCDVIGMTNMPEAKLAREAELCYASAAMITDYDSATTERRHFRHHRDLGCQSGSGEIDGRGFCCTAGKPPSLIPADRC